MKNIHVLPTDKPSRFYYNNNDKQFQLCEIEKKPTDLKPNQNIYITNDEEINQNTKPCWCLNTIKKTWNDDVVYFQGAMPQYHYIGFKKIILTDNPDIVKDGVQAIDDEFLEWFIKNPSCESVVIENRKRYEFEHLCDDSKNIGYMDYSQINPTYKETSIKNWNEIKDCNFYKIIIPKDEPKKETLEEVAEKESEKRYPVLTHKNPDDSPYIESKKTFKHGVNFGAKWQQQQDKNLYSEIIDLFERSSSIYYEGCDLDINYESEKSKIINQLKEII